MTGLVLYLMTVTVPTGYGPPIVATHPWATLAECQRQGEAARVGWLWAGRRAQWRCEVEEVVAGGDLIPGNF